MLSRRMMCALVLAMPGALPLVGCGEEARAIEITFTNATDRRVVMFVERGDETVAQYLNGGKQVLPYTHEPGESWRHDAPTPLGGEPPDGQWCEPRVTYVFMSPKDPSVRSRGVSYQHDPQLPIEELDEIDRLTAPCWEKRTGNTYSIIQDH